MLEGTKANIIDVSFEISFVRDVVLPARSAKQRSGSRLRAARPARRFRGNAPFARPLERSKTLAQCFDQGDFLAE